MRSSGKIKIVTGILKLSRVGPKITFSNCVLGMSKKSTAVYILVFCSTWLHLEYSGA